MADLLIETFPISGGMVRLEAMACKLPIVAFHNEKFPLFTGQSKLPPDYPFEGSKDDEIVNYSSILIGNKKIREKIGKELYNYYKEELSLQKIRHALMDIIVDTGNHSIITDGKSKCNYNIEYARIYQSDIDFESYEKLLLQSILKKSSFSLFERIKLYYKTLKNEEFETSKLVLMYALLSIIGWNGLSILMGMLKD